MKDNETRKVKRLMIRNPNEDTASFSGELVDSQQLLPRFSDTNGGSDVIRDGMSARPRYRTSIILENFCSWTILK